MEESNQAPEVLETPSDFNPQDILKKFKNSLQDLRRNDVTLNINLIVNSEAFPINFK